MPSPPPARSAPSLVLDPGGLHVRYYRQLLLGRALTCTAILAVIGAIELSIGTTAETRPIVVLVAVLLGLTVPYGVLARTRPDALRRIGLAVIVIDTGLLTLGEYLLGGENALYGLPLYGILIVMAAVVHSRRAAYAVAGLGAASYGAMVSAVYAGWIPERPPLVVYSIVETWPAATAANNLFLGLAMAAVASSLSRIKDDALAVSRAAQAELASLNAGLASKIDAATAALRHINDELLSRNDDLETALAQVNIYAGAVSHDIRNPLTAANEALRISETASREDRSRFLTLARENLGRADRMVTGLRDVMLAFGGPSSVESVSVAQLVAEISDEVRAAAAGRDFTLRVEGDLGQLRADRFGLTHVFRNLVSNALAHNPTAPNLRIRIGRTTSGDTPSFFVADDGRGIPESIHEKIFRPFHRGPGAPAEGLGLGLALVHAIVHHAGGRVWVESEPGRGAHFAFSWPETGREA